MSDASTAARRRSLSALAGLCLLAFAAPAQAGPRVYENEETGAWVDLGILVQAQYRLEGPDGGPLDNDIWLRRLRPTLAGGFNEDWQAIIQIDFGAGASGDTYEVTVRWANFQWVGLKNAHLVMGSFKNWFSREFITLGPQLQFIERTFVGENTYGNPAYTIGLGWDHIVANERVFYAVNIGAQDVSTDAAKMQFASPANGSGTDNDGWSAAARLDFYALGRAKPDKPPLGYRLSPYDRSDINDSQSWLLSFSLAAYAWWNQGSNNGECGNSDPSTCVDLQNSVGLEVSGGLRGHGFSGDFEYQYVRGNTVEEGYTGGLYADGQTSLQKATLGAGYLVVPKHLELAAGWSILGASNYDNPWNRVLVGVNGFVIGYSIRFSADYVREINAMGAGQNGNLFRVQAQFVW